MLTVIPRSPVTPNDRDAGRVRAQDARSTARTRPGLCCSPAPGTGPGTPWSLNVRLPSARSDLPAGHWLATWEVSMVAPASQTCEGAMGTMPGE